MRSYHDLIAVRRGRVGGVEAPEQFLWRDRLWVVRVVLASWIETGAWWKQPGVAALRGTDGSAPGDASWCAAADLVAEQEMWRVEAGRGRTAGLGSGSGSGLGYGVFDLAFDAGDGRWELVRSLD